MVRLAISSLVGVFAVAGLVFAEAVVEEWRAQGATVAPATMPLTKLANTAIDRVVGHEDDVVEMVAAPALALAGWAAVDPAGVVGG